MRSSVCSRLIVLSHQRIRKDGMGCSIILLPVFNKCPSFLTVSDWRVFVNSSLTEFNIIKDVLELQQALVVDFSVPIWISAVAWINICLIVVADKWNGPESGGKVCGVIRVPRMNKFSVLVGVIIRVENCFRDLFLPDNRGITHQLLLVIAKDFSWRIKSDILSD